MPSLRQFFSHRLIWLALLVALGIGALFARTIWTIRNDEWSYAAQTNANLARTLEHAGVLGRMMALAPKLALEQGCNPYPDGGFRVVVNTGLEGGQETHHLHIHVMGGPRPWLKG